MQPELPFDESTPRAALSASEPLPGHPVPREPGWALLGGAGRLWHRVATTDGHGSLVAACGLGGRYIADVEHEIIKCPACEANQPTP
jgi:hypothetical protein